MFDLLFSFELLYAVNATNIDNPKNIKNELVSVTAIKNTPEEIAISILAEIKTIFSKRSGERLKFRDRPIYEVWDSFEILAVRFHQFRLPLKIVFQSSLVIKSTHVLGGFFILFEVIYLKSTIS